MFKKMNKKYPNDPAATLDTCSSQKVKSQNTKGV
jgi:hypothetical protein